MFRNVIVLGSLGILTWSLPAAAFGDVTIYDNAQSVPIGGRAAGMGGAYTALACDEGALHYNPASLSCAGSSHLGSSMTLGLLGKQSRAWIGMAGEIGHTTTKTPGRGFTYENTVSLRPGSPPSDSETTLVRWTVTGILGSNYTFLD